MKFILPLLSVTLLCAVPYGKDTGAADSAPEMSQDTVYRKIENNAWTFGENLEYRVHYGLINAGKITLKVENGLRELQQRKAYHVNAEGFSVSGFDWIFKVRDHFETFIDDKAIVPLQFQKRMEEGDYKDTDFAIFSHAKKKVFAKKGTVEVPANVQDVVSAIYYARTLDVKNAKPGQVFPIQVYLDGEVFMLGIKYLGRETINTDVGSIRAIKIQPMVVADRVFSDKDGLMLWVSDDENKVPLRVEAELLVGSLKVDLIKHSGLKHPINKAG